MPVDRGAARPVAARLARIAVVAIGMFLILTVFFSVLYGEVAPPATPAMLVRLAAGQAVDQRWRSLDEISPFLIRAVLASEDETFCLHHGFDHGPYDTAWRTYESRSRPGNAGTISMQAAENAFLWPGRGWLRRGLGTYFTALAELTWGKRRILEMYLNLIEWGPGIYGAEAAAQHYFRTSAARLTPYQAVDLAAVLSDPLEWSPDQPNEEMAARSRFIVDQIPQLPVSEPLPCGTGP